MLINTLIYLFDHIKLIEWAQNIHEYTQRKNKCSVFSFENELIIRSEIQTHRFNMHIYGKTEKEKHNINCVLHTYTKHITYTKLTKYQNIMNRILYMIFRYSLSAIMNR